MSEETQAKHGEFERAPVPKSHIRGLKAFVGGVAELFGVKILGRIMGVVITADVLGEAFAPVLVGYIRDQSGSYTHGFTTLIVLAVVGTIAISLLPKKPAAIKS